jgi:hypothetical protein
MVDPNFGDPVGYGVEMALTNNKASGELNDSPYNNGALA